MQIIDNLAEMLALCQKWQRDEESLVLVPTMGYYHSGHTSLFDRAKPLARHLVASLFVNPMQFAPGEDFEAYPRDLDRDAKLAKEHGVEILFTPKASELYLADHATWIEVPSLAQYLCGASRPTHFRGVCTVVFKFFHLLKPDFAVFGEKDWQQQIIIKRMVKDLGLPVEIVTVPTAREADGLAMSSRNAFLTKKEREQASQLYKGLQSAALLASHGECLANVLKNTVRAYWEKFLPLGKVDYLEIVHPEKLNPVESLPSKEASLMACAVYLGKARLIDNILLIPNKAKS